MSAIQGLKRLFLSSERASPVVRVRLMSGAMYVDPEEVIRSQAFQDKLKGVELLERTIWPNNRRSATNGSVGDRGVEE